ncbi:helix-turn-helix transcriptional regulator [Latilactobacillus curvatus]|uniref:helix-turn-helix transcriptional regulator n=1 Tax=Latilactobacillus curvatus TaxID=28038 RepID=UPI00057E62EC|nr:helix-turn-helix transcriptional regulator [Latilactobacillus curvatus]ANY13506.1 hypothetical protein BCY75_05700 [Latilactobacillus curvatus]WIE01502.1 helix-turn-helix transcriptional regulator [Latilactobacillus curvatus]
MRKLKELRKSKGITQEELAKDLGVATVTIRKIESSDRNPSINTAKKISRYFGKNLEYIFPDIFLLK